MTKVLKRYREVRSAWKMYGDLGLILIPVVQQIFEDAPIDDVKLKYWLCKGILVAGILFKFWTNKKDDDVKRKEE